ncbi:hypothetical protein BG004_004199 [Podila humilis]|nr:hypothetical protein BG004_004199 [Podila humilis]
MATTTNNAHVFGAALALRLALFEIPGLANTLGNQVEISTPVTMSEGVYLFRNGVPPYDGGVFHQAPLLLGLFYPIISSPLLVKLLYTLTDLAIGFILLQIALLKDKATSKEQKIKEYGGGMETPGMTGLTVATLYLFNPYSIVSCIGKSTILFSNLAVVAGIWMGMKGDRGLAMFSIAVASYLSLYPAMLAIPVLILVTDGIHDLDTKKRIIFRSSVFFMASLCALFLLSFVLTNSWDFFGSVYGTILAVGDLTPNLGLFWYFFIEMFDQFRPFFLIVFQIHVFIFAVPISIKLSTVMGTFKGYPSVGDAALYLGLLPLCSEIFKYMRYSFLIVNLFLYSSLLAPIFWYLWVYVGSGNANFFYAIGLVYGIGEIILMIDTTFALLRRDFEATCPVDTSDANGWDRDVVQKYHCIYPLLGRSGSCPTCGTKAIVGNLLDFTSYDVLLSCVDKLATMRMNMTAKGTLKIIIKADRIPSSSEKERTRREGTPMGTVIWTYDCGPTMPSFNHADRSDTSSVAEATSMPSVDAALAVHNRELLNRAQNQKEPDQAEMASKTVVGTRSPATNTESSAAPSEQEPTQPKTSIATMPPPAIPPPTFQQLQRLFARENSETEDIPNSQEQEEPTQTLSIRHDLSQLSDAEPFEPLSAPIHAYQSSVGTIQLSQDEPSILDSYSQAMVKNKRKTSTDPHDTRHSMTPAPQQKRRQGRAPSYQPEVVAPHRKNNKDAEDSKKDVARPAIISAIKGTAPVTERKTKQLLQAHAISAIKDLRAQRRILLESSRSGSETVPTSEDEADETPTTVVTNRGHEEVQSSLPTIDDAFMPSLYHLHLRRRSESRAGSLDSEHRQLLRDPPGGSSSFGVLGSAPLAGGETTRIVSCIFSGISESEFDANITRLVEAGLLMEHITEPEWDDNNCTCIVTNSEANSFYNGATSQLCPRTLKYLQGLLSPVWIVRWEWFQDSIKAKTWLPLHIWSEYLVHGDTHFGPAPGIHLRRQVRQEHSLRLFESCKLLFYGDFKDKKSFSRLELQKLVLRGGGSVLKRRPAKSALGISSQENSSSTITPTGGATHNKSSNYDPTDNTVTVFGHNQTFLYLPETVKPWRTNIDRRQLIVVCDPASIPNTIGSSSSSPSSSPASMELSAAEVKKHGWLRDCQAVSLMWLLNCISCSVMGMEDIDCLNQHVVGDHPERVAEMTREQVLELEQTWNQWQNRGLTL